MSDFEATDKAALFEEMARAWWNASRVRESYTPPREWSDANAAQRADVLGHCRALYVGCINPKGRADFAALALLTPAPDDSDPVTTADLALMAVCPTCGGAGRVINVDGDFGDHREPLLIPCDDCNGTGKRGG